MALKLLLPVLHVGQDLDILEHVGALLAWRPDSLPLLVGETLRPAQPWCWGAQVSWLVSMVGARVGAAAAQRALEVLCEDDPSLAAQAGGPDAGGVPAANGAASAAAGTPQGL